MSSDRTDVTIIFTSAIVAVAAILGDVIGIGQPLQFSATLGAILLGPGGLACRLVSNSKWSECLMVGIAANIAALMLLSLMAVAVHFWHPKIELIIPAATCVLAILLYRRRAEYIRQGDHKGYGDNRVSE